MPNPTLPLSLPISSKPLALVLEDEPLTSRRVAMHLSEQGYEVIETPWLKEAKAYAPYVEKIITDYDLSKVGGFRARNDGIDFLKWIGDEQSRGQLPQLREVTLHSTVLDKTDIQGKLFGSMLEKKVEGLGFEHQPKRVILGN